MFTTKYLLHHRPPPLLATVIDLFYGKHFPPIYMQHITYSYIFSFCENCFFREVLNRIYDHFGGFHLGCWCLIELHF